MLQFATAETCRRSLGTSGFLGRQKDGGQNDALDPFRYQPGRGMRSAGLFDQRMAVGPVMAVAGEEPHAIVLTGNLVNPV
jgi:hypothetical protein